MRFFNLILLFILILQGNGLTRGQSFDWIQLERVERHDHMQILKDVTEQKRYNPDSSWHILLSLLQESWLQRDISLMRHCLVALSGFTEDTKFHDRALHYARRGVQLSDTLKHRQELCALYDNISKIQFKRSLYPESLEASLKAAYYANDNPVKLAKIESNMIGLLAFMSKKETALDCADRSIATGAKYQNGELWSAALNNKAHILNNGEKTNLREVFFYLDSGIRVAHRFKQFHHLYSALVNKSSILAKNGHPEESIRLLQAADTLSSYFTIPVPARMKAHEVAGTAYGKLGQFALAEQNFLKSIQYTDKHNSLSTLLELSRVYADYGRYKQAYKSYKQFRENLDSFASKEAQNQVRHLEMQYRTLEKDKEIAENKLLLSAKEHDLKVKNLWIVIFATGGMLLLSLVLFLRRNYNHKKKMLLAEQDNIRLKARIDGEELERKRIAGELHDGIGGMLSAAKMNLSNIDSEILNNYPGYERSVHLLDEAYKELRRTAHNLSPNILKGKGLTATVLSYCQKTTAAHGIQLKFQHFGNLDLLDEVIALSIYRIIQELIQNVIKHSGATTVMVQLNLQDDCLNIIVEDNGKGMPEFRKEGIGLSNIKDRIKTLNGELEIDSRNEEGTAIYISIGIIPYPAKSRKYSSSE